MRGIAFSHQPKPWVKAQGPSRTCIEINQEEDAGSTRMVRGHPDCRMRQGSVRLCPTPKSLTLNLEFQTPTRRLTAGARPIPPPAAPHRPLLQRSLSTAPFRAILADRGHRDGVGTAPIFPVPSIFPFGRIPDSLHFIFKNDFPAP